MNKNRIFLLSMVLVSILLFLLSFTGLVAHIIISVVGLAVMIPLTIKTVKDWKTPALEIIMRAMYFVTIVTGGIMMKVHGIMALNIGHKVGAALFLVLLLALYIPKWNKE